MDDLDRRIAELGGYFTDLERYRPATEADVVEIERVVGARLPADYRGFLLVYGGIAPHDGHWTVVPDADDWRAGEVALEGFLGFGAPHNPWLTAGYELDLHAAIAGWRDRVGPDLMPIALWQGGDPVLIGLRGRVRSEIWHFAHDHPRGGGHLTPDDAGPWTECLYRTAPSFAALLRGLVRSEPLAAEAVEPGHAAILRRSQAIARQRAEDGAPGAQQIERIARLLTGFDKFPRPNDHAAELHVDLCGLVQQPADTTMTEIRRTRIRGHLAWISGQRPTNPEVAAMFTRLLQVVRPAAAPPVAPPAQVQRVRHARFGDGTVVSTGEGDKCTVRFDDGSERTLLRRFITAVEKP